MDKTLILASNNSGKLRELNVLLADLDWELIIQSELGIPEVEETATSFVENAIIKACHAASIGGRPALADDSGLVVDALGGTPGVYSSRYAGVNATDKQNLNKLTVEIEAIPPEKRVAHFVCVMVFMRSATDPIPLIAEGVWFGEIITQPRGFNGFGYDSIFYLPEYQLTAAELPPETKNKISHRGQALRQLIHRLSVS